MNKHNFSAGPSILPQQVIEEASNAVKEWSSVGGFRSSIYNAMSVESIEHLIKVMRDFEISHPII